MAANAATEEILSVDVPFSLLQGQVRNENEARELAALDVAALREAGALQHTLSFCAYDAGLRAAADALREAGPDPELNAAAVLVDTARAAVKRNLAVLSTEVEGASRQLRAAAPVGGSARSSSITKEKLRPGSAPAGSPYVRCSDSR